MARSRAKWPWIALGVVLLAAAALIEVREVLPRATVRWDADVSAADRAALEKRYDLRNGEGIEGAATGWRYELGDRTTENIRALIAEPAVDDTGGIERDTLRVPGRSFDVRMRAAWYPYSDRFDRPSQLLDLLPTVWLALAGGILLSAARASSERLRRHATIATLVLICAIAWARPIPPSFVRMGDSGQNAQSRGTFEGWVGVNGIRYEAHLSNAILGQLYQRGDQGEDAPARAQATLARAAAAWFVVCALAIGTLERWSPMVVRYLGLALLAPGAILYFGWREVGYLSLNVATFPLLARGLRDGGWRIEAGSILAGFGSALHGLGLISLLGAWLAALTGRAPGRERVARFLRIAAFGTAAYVGWVAIYVIILNLPIVIGHAENFPWRPWFTDTITEGRLNVAIFSATGARDLFFTAFVVGAPLLVLGASLRHTDRDAVRTAMAYGLVSLVFTICSWPVLGIGQDVDIVLAGFPAVYAGAWLCAHDSKRTYIAAALLICGHYAFWRICVDSRFEHPALF